MYINTAEAISGIPSSWPGYTLKIGSSGNKVRQMQEQLNVIAGAYPAIPKITADGIYGPATAEAVRVFQKVFGLPQTGEVDYTTWYKISEIYVGVSRIAELNWKIALYVIVIWQIELDSKNRKEIKIDIFPIFINISVSTFILIYNPDNVRITKSTSLFSNSWIICKYVFCVVVILACPNLRATLAIDTPANNSSEACVCLSPWMEISDIPHALQCLVSTSFTVELYILVSPTKIGSFSGNPFVTSENFTTICQSIWIFLTDDLFFVGKNPPFPL